MNDEPEVYYPPRAVPVRCQLPDGAPYVFTLRAVNRDAPEWQRRCAAVSLGFAKGGGAKLQFVAQQIAPEYRYALTFDRGHFEGARKRIGTWTGTGAELLALAELVIEPAPTLPE